MSLVRAYRICQQRVARGAFSGDGAAKYGGRWNSRGQRVVYLSDSISLAALEILVHTTEREDLARVPYVFFEVEFDLRWIADPPRLPPKWNDAMELSVAQRVGDQWLEGGKTCVLRVPSAIIPQQHNLLANPAHPDFGKLKIGKPQHFDFDARLATASKRGARS